MQAKSIGFGYVRINNSGTQAQQEKNNRIVKGLAIQTDSFGGCDMYESGENSITAKKITIQKDRIGSCKINGNINTIKGISLKEYKAYCALLQAGVPASIKTELKELDKNVTEQDRVLAGARMFNSIIAGIF